MNLNKVFGKAERGEEKKLEVVLNENTTMEELLSCYERGLTKMYYHITIWEIFQIFKDYAQRITIPPPLITSFSHKLLEGMPTNKHKKADWNKGIFLSTLIQISYEQGYNNFEFDEISSIRLFGFYLKGKEEKPIKIKAKTISSFRILDYATNCYLEAEKIVGECSLPNANQCHLKAKAIIGNFHASCAKNCFIGAKTIDGDFFLHRSKNCVAEIENYHGSNFGEGMENCKIYSPNEESLKILKEQNRHKGKNRFISSAMNTKK